MRVTDKSLNAARTHSLTLDTREAPKKKPLLVSA
eukprot:COSAG06_NODE_57446_length_280_cov_0.839779_1_plen_33_part_01